MISELHVSLRHGSCEPEVDGPARDGVISVFVRLNMIAHFQQGVFGVLWCSIVFLKAVLIVDYRDSHIFFFRIYNFTFQASLYGKMMF